jgi:AcrR family transcriptional regulator
MALFARCVYERGYEQTSLGDVAERHGVSVQAVRGHWPNKVDCLLDTTAVYAERLFTRMAEAFMEVDDDAALALHRALATMLDELARAPEITYLSFVELPQLGPLLHASRDRTLERFSAFFGAGLAALPDHAPSEGITRCITGGLWETVRRYALERRLHELPEALPAMSHFCLVPFFGSDEARRVGAAVVAQRA